VLMVNMRSNWRGVVGVWRWCWWGRMMKGQNKTMMWMMNS